MDLFFVKKSAKEKISAYQNNYLYLKIFFTLLLLFFSANIFAQSDSVLNKNQPEIFHPLSPLDFGGNYPKKQDKPLRKLSISGYYRQFATYRVFKDCYPEFDKNKKNLFIGDDQQLPNLLLNISGKPSANTSFGTDIYFMNFLYGNINDTTQKGLGINLGINVNGSFSTNIGSFNILAGGINWYSLSPMTFGTNVVYNRFTVFERNPWDPPVKSVDTRYEQFYSSGALDQDARWGKQAFQGLILEGVGLPGNISFSALYGKTALNGGFASLPNSSYGGRIMKNFAGDYLAFNTFNSFAYTDSLNKNSLGFNIHTLEYRYNLKGILFSGEIGMGKYYSPDYNKSWGEAINFKMKTPKKLTYFPIEIQLFQISPQVINNNSAFWNSSIVEYKNNAGQAVVSQVFQPVSSAIARVGQLVNNRRGLNLNVEMEIGSLKLNVGYGNSKEIENISSIITYGHSVNNLTISRFWHWTLQYGAVAVGPYKNQQRLTEIFRGVFETVHLTDDTSGNINPKYFNTFEPQAKYHLKLFRKDLYLFYVGSYSSVQPNFSTFTNFSETPYIRAYESEFEAYYKYSSTFMFTGYFGYERVLGNYSTDLDSISGRPRNQTGVGIGIGTDIQLSKNVGLYFRHRWFDFKDENFSLDRYNGTETIAELKVYF